MHKISFENKLNLFIVLKWDDNSKLFETMVLSLALFWIFVLNFAICESGERITHQFDQFHIEIGRCEWNKLPIEMQRMYLIFLSDTQQPVNIRSYGGILCTRETFKKVISIKRRNVSTRILN